MIHGIRYRRGWFGRLIVQVKVRAGVTFFGDPNYEWRDARVEDLPALEVKPCS
jgi:hypothetical protein